MTRDSESGTVEFLGETFSVPERMDYRTFLRFARAASEGVDDGSMDGLAAVDAMLDQCIEPADKARFDKLCARERPDMEQLMEFIASAMNAMSARPTSRPSDSAGGPMTTEPTSVPRSSGSVIESLERGGRPDLALIHTQALEARSA